MKPAVHRKKNIGITGDPDCYPMVKTDQIPESDRGLHLRQVTGLHAATEHWPVLIDNRSDQRFRERLTEALLNGAQPVLWVMQNEAVCDAG